MGAEPRHVGPIEGREVHRDDGPSAPVGPPHAHGTAPGAATPPPSPAAGSSTASGPAGPGTAVARADGATGTDLRSVWGDIRSARGRDVPNSRPLPAWVRRFSWVLDDAFPVPGLPGRRVGVDGVIAVVPVAGGVVGAALSLVIVVVGIAAGASIPTILRMLLNVGFEALVGAVPFFGAVFNMAFKANDRNVGLIERDLADRRATRRSSLAVLVLTAMTAVAGIVMLVVVSLLGITLLILLINRWL